MALTLRRFDIIAEYQLDAAEPPRKEDARTALDRERVYQIWIAMAKLVEGMPF